MPERENETDNSIKLPKEATGAEVERRLNRYAEFHEKATLYECEWNFSWVPKDQLNVVFFYEYARESEVVRSSVEKINAAGGWGALLHACIVDGNEVSQEKRSRRELAQQYAISEFGRAVGRLSQLVPIFPSVPHARFDWAKLDDPFLGVGEAFFTPSGALECPFSLMLRLPSFDQCSRSFDSGEFWAEMDALKKDNFSYFLTVPKKADLESVLEGIVKWIRCDWERAGLPTRKKAPKQTLWLGGVRLPFSCMTALEWLGVLRRYNDLGGSWDDYAQKYGYSGDIGDFKRAALIKANKAREILKFFDAGGRGEIVTDKSLIRWVPDQST